MKLSDHLSKRQQEQLKKMTLSLPKRNKHKRKQKAKKKKHKCRECQSHNIVFDTRKNGNKLKICLDCGVVIETEERIDWADMMGSNNRGLKRKKGGAWTNG